MPWPTPNVIGLPFDARFGRWGGADDYLYSPTQLPDLTAWFDGLDTSTMLAGDGTTITDGGSVALWGDKSGNSGTNALILPGSSGNYGSVPDSVAVSVTGDIDIRTHAMLYSLGAFTFLTTKDDQSAQRSYSFFVTSTGYLKAEFNKSGPAMVAPTATATLASVGVTTYAYYWFRVTRATASGDTIFYISTDGATWTKVGDTVSTAAGDIIDSTQEVQFGRAAANYSNTIIRRSQVRNSIVGTTTSPTNDAGAYVVLDVDFSLAAKKLANGDTFTCATGQTVTLNSSGATGARIAGERDLYQGTAANRPVYLGFSGTNYGYLNGATGAYYSTPDADPVGVTGDIDVRWYGSLTSMSATQVLVDKARTAGQRSYSLYLNGGGFIVGQISLDGTTNIATNSSAHGVSAGTEIWFRFTRVSATGLFSFFKSTDGSSWTAIGTAAGTSGAIFDGTDELRVGASTAGSFQATGKMLRAQVYDGIGGTLVADFNPALYTSGTTFTASTGEVWTLNGGAKIVQRSGLYGNGSTTAMQNAKYSAAQAITEYIFGEQESWTSGDYIIDGSAANAAGIVQTTSTPQINLNAGASAAGNTGFALKTFGMLRAVFNGASSLLGVNRVAPTTGDAGSTAANGLTVFASGGLANHGNAFIAEVIQYTAAQDAATGGRVALYGGRRHRFAP